MRKVLSTMAIVAASVAFAQVGISSGTNDTPAATLDVRALEKNTPDGILIPRVDKDRAQNMSAPEKSTLAWINNTGTGGSRTVDVDADGFYYYDGQSKWVKLGGGASASEPQKTIKVVNHIVINLWDNNQYALAQTSNGDIELPDPTGANKYRIISVNNQFTNTLNYVSLHSPINTSTLDSGKGHLLMSDGTGWYIIGGSY